MNDYDRVAQAAAQQLTEQYSTSFSKATRLFPAAIRADIYNIYGMVRVADEIVDTYDGADSTKLLDEFEQSIYDAMARGYSTNIISHAFALSAKRYGIERDIIEPFFSSMRTDSLKSYEASQYEAYIHGSAEVVGLMCLKVFVGGNNQQYEHLKTGAMALGSAFQKVNFLRDLADDQKRLGRYYFPIGSYEAFDEATKQTIVHDIRRDFKTAEAAIRQLPSSARLAVRSATKYYSALLNKIDKTLAEELRLKRVRIADSRKALLLIRLVVMNQLQNLSVGRKQKK